MSRFRYPFDFAQGFGTLDMTATNKGEKTRHFERNE